MTWKQILWKYIKECNFNYKKSRVEIKVIHREYRNEVAQTIMRNVNTLRLKGIYDGYYPQKNFIQGDGSGDEFTLHMENRDGNQNLYNNIMAIISDESNNPDPPQNAPGQDPPLGGAPQQPQNLPGQDPSSGGAPQQSQNAPGQNPPLGGSPQQSQMSYAKYTAPGVVENKGIGKTVMFVAGGVLLLAIILLLWKRK